MPSSVEQNGADGSVDVTFKDHLAIVTMNRGENRFNELMVDRLSAAFDEVLRNPNAKVMVTTGVGKFYSNGLDAAWMAHLQKTDPDRLDRFRVYMNSIITKRLLTFPLPTVALLNGHTFAAGAIMALSHDHVIMNNARGWWSLNEVHINLSFHPSTIELLKSKLPKGGTFQEAVVLGRRFAGDEAKAVGIVQESCPPSECLSRAQDWIRKVVPPAGYNREHLQTMKEDVYRRVLDLSGAPRKQFQPKL